MPDKEHAAEPVVDGKGRTQGGFSEVAQLLNELFPKRRRPISRQLVHKWWLYREDNQFPDAIDAVGTSHGGRGCSKFSYAEVIRWYERHRRYRDERRYTRDNTAAASATQPSRTGTEQDILAA